MERRPWVLASPAIAVASIGVAVRLKVWGDAASHPYWSLISNVLLGASALWLMALGVDFYLRRSPPIVLDLLGGSTEQEDQVPGGILSTRRLRVFNRGRESVENILIRVENTAPQSAPFYPIHLEIMNRVGQPLRLGPKQHEYVDVVTFNSADPLQQFWLAHDRQRHPHTPNGFPVPRLEIFICLQTDDRKTSHRFVVYRDRSGKVRLEHADPPTR